MITFGTLVGDSVQHKSSCAEARWIKEQTRWSEVCWRAMREPFKFIAEEIEQNIGKDHWQECDTAARKAILKAASLAWKAVFIILAIVEGLVRLKAQHKARSGADAALKRANEIWSEPDKSCFKEKWRTWQAQRTESSRHALRLEFQKLQDDDPDGAERFIKRELKPKKMGLPDQMLDGLTGESLTNGEELWGAARYILQRDVPKPEWEERVRKQIDCQIKDILKGSAVPAGPHQ